MPIALAVANNGSHTFACCVVSMVEVTERIEDCSKSWLAEGDDGIT